MGREKEPGTEDLPEALWAPQTAPHSSAAPLALSRLLFFILDDTSAWNVPPSSSDETLLITLPRRRHSPERASDQYIQSHPVSPPHSYPLSQHGLYFPR